MRCAAMNSNPPQLFLVQRVAEAMRAEDLSGWRAEVEDFITAMGARPALAHVAGAVWDSHFFEGLDPEDAVLDELEKVDG